MLILYKNTTGRVLAVGQRPFAHEEFLTDFSEGEFEGDMGLDFWNYIYSEEEVVTQESSEVDGEIVVTDVVTIVGKVTYEPLDTKPCFSWEEVRYRRNELLAECDWTQISDCPLSEVSKLEWATYRQALRDLPEGYSNPLDVVFPDKPI